MAKLRRVIDRAGLSLEELGCIVAALRLFQATLVGESPYIDALRSGLAKLEALLPTPRRKGELPPGTINNSPKAPVEEME